MIFVLENLWYVDIIDSMTTVFFISAGNEQSLVPIDNEESLQDGKNHLNYSCLVEC